MQKRRVWIGFLAGLIAGLSLASFAAQPTPERAEELLQEFFTPLTWLIAQVENSYVEEVQPHRLLVGAYQGILSKLDRYSVYYPPDAYKEFKADTQGQFGGLGMVIYFDLLKKVVVVEQTLPGTPAFREGVLRGDMIVEVQEADQVVKTEDFEDVHDALRVLRGKKGTKVTITVIRGDSGEKKEITIKRDTIKIPGVRSMRMVDLQKKIGYIYIADFHKRLAADLRKEITKLQKEGMKGLVLDLRFNKGGLLQSSLEVSDMFLDSGVIVSTKGRASQSEVYRAASGQVYPDLALVVLVNRGSASAAEIVTAALRDNKRAVVVGEPTFGKAGVQTVMENPHDDSAIKLTTAHYYTPAEELIEGKGVEPDVKIELSNEQMRELMEHLSRQLGYAAEEPEGEPEKPEDTDGAESDGESDEEFRDVQLERAVEVLTNVLEGKPAQAALPAPADTVPVPAAAN